MASPQNKIAETTPKDDDMNTDDWAGLTDPAERRRRQNRINQRAHRKRQRMQKKEKEVHRNVHPKSVVPANKNPPWPSSPVGELDLSQEMSVFGCMKPESRDLLDKFAQAAYQSYILGSPTSDHLLMLTKVNVFRAFGHNMRLIGSDMNHMDDNAISIFNKALPAPPEGLSPGENSIIPASLRPTKLQSTVPHHPWLDFFPIPKMRDNLIAAGDEWDDEKLCLDIMGFWTNSTSAEAGLLVWGDPWDPSNWEITEDFLKRWQWVVRGCPELMNSTNAWRAKRGEKLIFRYI
ncbi:hypothetical protein N7493_004484 [Penicillium malachiteum]|uniref:BZIP domain-containing protein n=1 Tax=Penicillium malachiteum TaxID=1324776 RepID=A0AAD6HNM2_9EURO|nr:hypothetical protein N7493_004484 [Penicillium malachiteum]